MNQARSVAQEVADGLNAKKDWSFSEAFTARRIYDVRVQRDKLDAVDVGVVAVSQHSERASRGAILETIEVDVAVRRHVAAATPAGIDPLMDFLQEIATHFLSAAGRSLSSAKVQKAGTIGGSVAGMFVGDLESMDVFTAVVRLTILAVH